MRFPDVGSGECRCRHLSAGKSQVQVGPGKSRWVDGREAETVCLAQITPWSCSLASSVLASAPTCCYLSYLPHGCYSSDSPSLTPPLPPYPLSFPPCHKCRFTYLSPSLPYLCSPVPPSLSIAVFVPPSLHLLTIPLFPSHKCCQNMSVTC